MELPIPVNEPLFRGREKEYLNECIDSGWISFEGPFVKRFESEFAGLHGVEHGISVSNGTAALELAFAALDLKPGDEVIMPSFTIISCARAVLLAGATPVLVDVDPLTWNMVAEDAIRKITPRTKVILVVHTYGLPVDLDPLLEVCEQKNISIVEDVAEAIGLNYKNRICGSFGRLSIFSFYPNKHITTGEGGMILTNDDGVALKCRMLRNLAFQDERRFVHDELAPNYRLTNLQAGIGLAQIEVLEDTITRKRKIGQLYLDKLSECRFLQLPLRETSFAENIFWVFGIVIKDEFKLSASKLIAELKKGGIGCREFFWPMHEQPVFAEENFAASPKDYPVSSRIARKGLYLPSGISLTEKQINTVCSVLLKTLSTLVE
ncbi:MAG: aminotransferase DegT [Myxococcales bacterium]|nr:aminotransferase DegT [Myxococcales bacterium]